jgi:hypothetical protein
MCRRSVPVLLWRLPWKRLDVAIFKVFKVRKQAIRVGNKVGSNFAGPRTWGPDVVVHKLAAIRQSFGS